MRTRILLACGLAAGAFLFGHVSPGAQEAKLEPARFTREYDVDHLLSTRESLPATVADLDPWRFGYHGKASELQWHLEGAGGSPAVDLAAILNELDRFGDAKHWEITAAPGRRLIVEADEAFHKNVAAILAWLNHLLDASIQIEVLKLDAFPVKSVLTAGEAAVLKGKLIGMQQIGHGGRAVFSDVQRKTLIWELYWGPHGVIPESGDIAWGKQWQVGAVMLPGGRIQLNGYAAFADLKGVAQVDTPAGVTELPHLGYRHASVAGVVDNAGGLVCDAGADGLYLIRAKCDVRLEHLLLSQGRFSFWHPAGVLRPGDLDGAWLLRDAAPPTFSGVRVLPQCEPLGDSAPVFGHSVHELALDALIESVDEDINFDAGVRTGRASPFFAVTYDQDGDEKYPPRRKNLAESLNQATRGAPNRVLHVVMARIPRNAVLPKAVVDGSPGAADVDAMRKVGTWIADRRIVIAQGQAGACTGLDLRNFIDVYDKPYVEPEGKLHGNASTFAQGWQVSLRPGYNDSLLARAGFVPDARWREFKLEKEFAGLSLQRPEFVSSEVRFNSTLRSGGWVSQVQPLGENEWLVVAIGREE